MPTSGRRRNPRLLATQRARRIKELANHIVADGMCRSGRTVWLSPTERTEPGVHERPRLPHEYAEQIPQYWIDMRARLRVIQAELVELDRLAAENLDRLSSESEGADHG